MSRIEFMSELRALLSDLSVEERDEALQYYNDYFDDAGTENEASIIKELVSPAKLAATIKAGLNGRDEEESEYSETGYTDTRFDTKDTPARKGGHAEGYRYNNKDKETGGYNYSGNSESEGYGYGGQTGRTNDYDYGGHYEKPRDSKALKIVLIILIILIGAPVVIPLAFGLLAAGIGILVSIAAVFIALLVAGGALVVSGIIMFVIGIANVAHSVPVALGVMGAGLLFSAVGAMLAVFMGWLFVKLVPPMFRWFVELCRRPFQKRKVNE